MSSGPPLDIPAESVVDQRSGDDLVRDTEFWFEGGSVVIVAGRVAFKVYRETLAVTSVVFQGMFHSLRTSYYVLTFDGCPVVRVSDSPGDFRHLLRVLFPRPTAGNAKIPFTHVSAYYDARYDFWASRDMGTLKDGAWHAIEAIEIAPLTGTEVILPLAFLDCASLGADLVRGYTREDVTHIHLSNEDLARTLKLSKYLRGQDLDAALDLGRYLAKCGAVDGCADPPQLPSDCVYRVAHERLSQAGGRSSSSASMGGNCAGVPAALFRVPSRVIALGSLAA